MECKDNSEKKSSDLVSTAVWNDKWNRVSLPRILDRRNAADRAWIKMFDNCFTSVDSNKTAIEVGCSPGRFLIHFSKKYGYKPYGVEYSSADAEITRRNCELSGVNAEIIESDFLKLAEDTQYDCVISAGFVEHFYDDLDYVLEKHAKLVRKGGCLFLSFPNFRYLNYAFAWLFRKKVLRMHNIGIMNKSFFRKYARKYGFDIEYLGYFGGVHPTGVKLSVGDSRLSLKGVLKGFAAVLGWIRNHECFDNINSRYFSHHLGAKLVKR